MITIRKEGVSRTTRSISNSPPVDVDPIVLHVPPDIPVTEALSLVPAQDPWLVVLAGTHAGATRAY